MSDIKGMLQNYKPGDVNKIHTALDKIDRNKSKSRYDTVFKICPQNNQQTCISYTGKLVDSKLNTIDQFWRYNQGFIECITNPNFVLDRSGNSV